MSNTGAAASKPTDAEFEARPLHLHTLESLLADLISGRPILTSEGKVYFISDEATRSALHWYQSKGPTVWTANVSATLTEDLVNSILKPTPKLAALPSRPANANSRRLKLSRMEVHRFGGLQKFGTPTDAPENYIHDFSSPIVLFEGRNGSGKTSLANAIIWALTGELLRPQREPEKADTDFDVWVTSENGSEEPTTHRMAPVTPMPNVDRYRPKQAWVPADTWVELIFVDEKGTALPPIRRSISRSARGVLTETAPNLSVLGIDPIGVRVGTIMPGLLSHIKVGAESELGRAVSQLTGLSALVDLADHAKRAKSKIDKEFIKAKTAEQDRADADYGTAKGDLKKEIDAHPGMTPPIAVPTASSDPTIEERLSEIKKYFEGLKATAFESARTILGQTFDPNNTALRTDLERNIGRALENVSRLASLPSATRLSGLRALSREQLASASTLIDTIVAEGKQLDALAQDPSVAARARLYARIAAWFDEHPDPLRTDDDCIVCGGPLQAALDPVSGRPIKTHLHDAKTDAVLLSQTVSRWSENARGLLARTLPEVLQRELTADLPEHPRGLLRSAIVDELFSLDPFAGVLAALKAETATAFDTTVAPRSDIPAAADIALPAGCDTLGQALRRIDRAIRFAKWRQENDALMRKILADVLGRAPKEGETREQLSLTGKLLDLDSTVKGAKPISDALILCDRLNAHLKLRRAAEKRLSEYTAASAAIGNLFALGDLADQQVDQLRKVLRKDAAAWRNRIYLGAFPDTAHELVDANMGRKGEIDLVVQSGGVAAPAQHVSNASALRASLVSFFLAFWGHVLKERGGLTMLLLDDPQELLDDENRERLASSLCPLGRSGAQLILTSYDPRFCGYVSRVAGSSHLEHLEVHPATHLQPVVRTTPPLAVIAGRKERFYADKNAEEPAREFADGCRVFLESKLSDLFDDPAHSAWASTNPDPTLATLVSRLRPQVKASPQGMFSAHIFRRFVEHPALVDGSPVLQLMNKSHHGKRQEIRAADVAVCADNLSELLEIAEQMYEECYRWRRRDAIRTQGQDAPGALKAMPNPALRVVVCPDLAAFTGDPPAGENQEIAEALDPNLLNDKALFFLRRENFGFAAPIGALAIVEATPGPAADRRLVIAREGTNVYARRFLRGKDTGIVGLTAEVPDPRIRTPKTIFLPEANLAIHQVVGILFRSDIKVERGPEEAIQIEGTGIFDGIETAFRVIEDSAIPLALPNQVVLGGARMDLNALAQAKDRLVALTLDDGGSIFKRVGAALPGELSHLRQFESIGGLGLSEVLSISKKQAGFRHVKSARIIVGVLYHG